MDPTAAIIALTVKSGGELKLGNVTFWVDEEGAWAGELSHDLPQSQWDRAAMQKDLEETMNRLGVPA